MIQPHVILTAASNCPIAYHKHRGSLICIKVTILPHELKHCDHELELYGRRLIAAEMFVLTCCLASADTGEKPRKQPEANPNPPYF